MRKSTAIVISALILIGSLIIAASILTADPETAQKTALEKAGEAVPEKAEKAVESRAAQDPEASKRETDGSLTGLATAYLGENSKIILDGTSVGVLTLSGSADVPQHCHLFIYIYGHDVIKMKCNVVNPVGDVFGLADHYEIVVKRKKPNIKPLYDAGVKFSMDAEVYDALVEILEFYADDNGHDAYLGDPLAESGLKHTFN